MLTFDDTAKIIQKQKHCCLSVLGKSLSTLTFDDIVKIIQKKKRYYIKCQKSVSPYSTTHITA
jgi:hypothetical protein